MVRIVVFSDPLAGLLYDDVTNDVV